MKLLDLFCGFKSVANVAKEMGFEVTTLDWDNSYNPDICENIMNIEEISGFDVIWASPPCECFSVASIGRYWNKNHTPKDKRAETALKLIEHTLSLIEKANPKCFFIENPRGKLRKMPCMNDFIRHTVTYCQYGDKRMKPTDIWTNNTIWKPIPMCKNGSPCHESAPRGSQSGTQGMENYAEKSRIPEQLVTEILKACL